MFAFVAVDSDRQREVIVGMRDQDHWQPLVTADTDEVERLKPIARRLARDSGREITLVRFTKSEELPL